MFKQTITATPFTTDDANNYFSNITGNTYGGDVSMLATLRALIAPRIPKDESIRVAFGNSSYSANEIRNATVEGGVRAICRSIAFDEYGFFYVHSFSNATEENAASFDVLEKKMCSVYSEFSRLEAVTAFFRKSFRVDCFINPKRKQVAVFVDELTNRRLHYIQCALLAMIPWYFDKEKGVTATEMELIKSLRETDSTNYLNLLTVLASQYNFKEARVRKLLDGFELRYERLELDRCKGQINNYDSTLQRLNEQIGQQIAMRNDTLIKIAGLEQKINEGTAEDSEIMEYFLCNNKLSLENVTDTRMEFVVKDYLSYFDRDMAERTIHNHRSTPYRNSRFTEEETERLLTELFLKEDSGLRIKTCAAYRFDLNGSVRGLSDYRFSAEYNDAIPNMHIQRHSCMSAYATIINDLLINRNYIGAIEQCVASCKSLNFGDGVVMDEFWSTLFRGSYGNSCCIELPDGRTVKITELLKWLKQKDEEAEKAAQETAKEEAAEAVEQEAEQNEQAEQPEAAETTEEE